jgi:hypothetical protein
MRYSDSSIFYLSFRNKIIQKYLFVSSTLKLKNKFWLKNYLDRWRTGSLVLWCPPKDFGPSSFVVYNCFPQQSRLNPALCLFGCSKTINCCKQSNAFAGKNIKNNRFLVGINLKTIFRNNKIFSQP